MNKPTIINWLILLILSFIWGSSFILMKKSLIDFNYLEVAFFRLIIAFLILSPFFINSLKKLELKYTFPIITVGVIGTVIPAVLFALSQIYLDSSNVGVLSALTPIFTLIVGVIIFYKHCTKKQLGGIIIGLFGTYILILPSNINIATTKYSLLVIIATICYAISINIIKEKLKNLKSLDIAVLSSFISFLIPMLYVVNNGLSITLTKIYLNISSFYYILILGTICTSIAIIIFNYLIKRSSALFSSSTTYLIPVFAILWGMVDGETMERHEILGIIIILIGVFIMNYKQA